MPHLPLVRNSKMSENEISKNRGEILIPVARAAITETLGISYHADEQATWLQDRAACFVTLMQKDNLRGCIGTLEAHRSLLEDVKHNAKAAAFYDTRFSPLSKDELDITEIEISLLSAMQPLHFSAEQEALAQLKPGIDGVVLESGFYRSTFLPQVWEQLANTHDFMRHLKTKAGLTADFWSDDIKLSTYTVSKWKEGDFKQAMDAPLEAPTP